MSEDPKIQESSETDKKHKNDVDSKGLQKDDKQHEEEKIDASKKQVS